jgi:hypothetical protein
MWITSETFAKRAEYFHVEYRDEGDTVLNN